jgi:ParB/RepB/Spo0J family partition protein
MTATFERIKTDWITPHDRNVRRDLGDLDELAASIKAQGLLQPLVVAPRTDSDSVTREYVIVAGHRRHAAATKAGLETVQCIVRDDLDTPAKVIEAMLVENLQRTDLTVMEEADAYAQLELLGVKEAAIVKTTGRSRKTVHERLLLASLPTERRQQYETGKLSLEGAVKCAKLRQQYADDTEILELIDKAGTYSFAQSGYGIDYTISRILEDRNRPQEPEDDDEDTIDYAGKRAEREAEWEKRQAEQKAEQERLAEIWRSHNEWIGGLIVRARSDEHTIYALARSVFAELVESQNVNEDVLPVIAVEANDEGDPVDWTDSDALLYLLLNEAPVEFEPAGWGSHHWNLRRRIQWMQSLGYSPTADDLAILQPAQEDDDEVA